MTDVEQRYMNHAELEAAGPQAGASMDKIRDILFGSQIKHFETRFARLEENLTRETAELKETTRRRFESVEGFLKTETESLAARLKSEREERSGALRTVEQDLKTAHDALGRKIQDLEGTTTEARSTLQREMMAESNKLLDDIAERHEVLRTLLERRIAELNYQKADRALLAGLLGEIAAQLGEDLPTVRLTETSAEEIDPRALEPTDHFARQLRPKSAGSVGQNGVNQSAVSHVAVTHVSASHAVKRPPAAYKKARAGAAVS